MQVASSDTHHIIHCLQGTVHNADENEVVVVEPIRKLAKHELQDAMDRLHLSCTAEPATSNSLCRPDVILQVMSS